MNNKFIIALDQGSSASRAVALDKEGQIVARSSRSVETIRPQANYAQLDTENLLRTQLDSLEEVIAQVGIEKISSLSVASQRSTIVFWDKQSGKPLAPALSWQDGRAEVPADLLKMGQEKVHEVTGLYATPFYSAAKIRWTLQHVPAVAQAAQEDRLCVGPVASYIIWHLTGGNIFACDPTLAQRTLLFDIKKLDWSELLLNIFEIQKSWLPQIKNTCDNYGNWEYKGAHVPIQVCVGDQQAALYALRIFEDNACINYGTGAFFMCNTGKRICSVPGLLTSVAASASTSEKNYEYLIEGPVNACGTVFTWLNAMGIQIKLEELDDLCDTAKHPVWFLPALGGLGAPYWDFSATPVMAGFVPETTKADVALGAVQGLTYLLADIIFYAQGHGIHSSEIKVAGGLAKNRVLLQNQADILQKNLIPCIENESTVLGTGLLAAVSSGMNISKWKTLETVNEIKPRLNAAQAKIRYQDWQKFVAWCKTCKSI